MSAAATPGSDELHTLYRELILEHAKSPRHFGRLTHSTHSAQGINPLCGDKLTVYLQIDRDTRIEDASFEGSGCAISVASASMMTDLLIGLSTAEASACFADITARLSGSGTRMLQSAAADIENLRALEGVREFPSRVKCATLAWHALDAAMQTSPAIVSTE